MPRTRRLFRGALVCALLAATATTAAGTAQATAPAASAAAVEKAVINGPVFNDPLAGPGSGTPTAEQTAVMDQLDRLIDAVPPDGVIRLALHEFKTGSTRAVPEIVDSLVAAHRRGTAVEVILNTSDKNEPVRQRLAQELGTDDAARSWVRGCGSGRGCLAANYSHNKFATFSKVVWADGTSHANVVFQSSSNLTDWYLFNSYNDAYTLSDSALYSAYGTYFEDLRKGTHRTTPDTDYGWTTPSGSTYRALFYPRSSAGADPIVNTLRSVTCSYTEDGQRKQTDIRIAMLHFTKHRAAVAEELLRLRGEGCWVDIVHDPGMEPEIAAILDRTAANGLRIQRRSCDITTDGRHVVPHTKIMMIDGAYDDDLVPRVYTGSANFTKLENSDDSQLRIMGRADHSAYLSWFYKVRAACAAG